ncbi:MAG: hypothetical protein MUO73_02640 [Thermoplasmata archaeon]|nr:hypothetical protein [Thermoplasmata archaeon]
MQKYSLLRKGLAVGIILLFIGVAIAPSINFNVVKASNDNDLVEVTTQACGLPGLKPQTVKLTKQQASEVENLFDSIKTRLDNATSRGETISIFNDAVVELDKYGLLGDLSVEKAQRLVTGRYQNLQKLPDIFSSTFLVTLDDNENRNCLITDKTTETWFESPMTILCYTIIFNYINNPNLAMPLLFVYMLLSEFSTYYNPFAVFFRINFGGVQYEHEMEPVDYYASGWVIHEVLMV